VILNPSRAHTTFGKYTTDFRTTFESAHQQFSQKYSNQERRNGIHLGMITDQSKMNIAQSYSTLRKDPKLLAILENLFE